jgi:hypothetical protein
MTKQLINFSLPLFVVDHFRTMSAIVCKLARDVGFSDIDQVSDGPRRARTAAKEEI